MILALLFLMLSLFSTYAMTRAQHPGLEGLYATTAVAALLLVPVALAV